MVPIIAVSSDFTVLVRHFSSPDYFPSISIPWRAPQVNKSINTIDYIFTQSNYFTYIRMYFILGRSIYCYHDKKSIDEW